MKILKNKKAQKIFVLLMVAIMAFIVLVIFAQPLKQEIGKAINTTTLNSSNPNISVESKATIIILDMGLFYFIGMIIAVSIAFVSGKRTITGVMTSIMVFIVTIVLITPLKTLVILVRDIDNLNCASSLISVGARLSCIVVDLWLFYLVVVVIASALTFAFTTKVLK